MGNMQLWDHVKEQIEFLSAIGSEVEENVEDPTSEQVHIGGEAYVDQESVGSQGTREQEQAVGVQVHHDGGSDVHLEQVHSRGQVPVEEALDDGKDSDAPGPVDILDLNVQTLSGLIKEIQ
jgi:hypothetical protein